MPPPLKIQLSESQRRELEDLRNHTPLPYLRERAAAIFKIADGYSGLETARKLLNRSHWQDTIYDWVKRYQTEGIDGLKIRSGRGRKPSFFPSVPKRSRRSRSD